MTAQTDNYISSFYNINIKDVVSNHLDFSSAGKFDFNEIVPRTYKVLIPDPHRGSSSSFGSPCTSHGDRDRQPSYQSSLYESSTASSSPLSITKELTSVGSPLTPRSDVSRSKSKSPTRYQAGSFLAEKSKSPTPGLNLTLTNESSRSPGTASPQQQLPPSEVNNTDQETVTKKKKKKKKKKNKKKERSESPTDTCSSRNESVSSLSSNSTESIQGSSALLQANEKVADKSMLNGVDSSTAKVAPIRLKMKEPERACLSNVFDSLTSPIKPKVMTIKLGKEILSRRAPLVDYNASDDDDDSHSEEKTDNTQLSDDEVAATKQSSSSSSKPIATATMPPLMSPRSIIGPLKPSTLPLPKREVIKVSPLTPAPSTSPAKVSPLIEKFKRKNGELDGNGADSPAVKRKRLLSERGEKEAAYPVMDKSTISHWNFKDCSVVRNRSRGVGLHNSCNDCFLNAILQVVTHTAPLCRYILEKHQNERCLRQQGQCLCCAMRTSHFTRAFSGSAFMPSWIRPYLRKIFPSHMHGMQEDAHELLSLMLDAIDPPPGSNKTNGAPNGLNVKPSTPIEQIFGGTLRNQITCTQCNTPYINYERIRELNLAIRKRPDGEAIRISNLMDNYFKDENVASFDCKKCSRKTTATRKTRVLRPPAVLLVQLKRFNAFGGKIRLPVCADMDVDLSRLMFDSAIPATSCQYVLTAVVEHLGSGVDHGHYIAYCRGFDHKQWHLFDDEMVSTVSPGKVMNSEPYLLVYSRRSDMGMSAKSVSDIACSSSSSIGPRPMGIGQQKQQNGSRTGAMMMKQGIPNKHNSNGGGQFNRNGFNNGYGGAFKKHNNNVRYKPNYIS